MLGSSQTLAPGEQQRTFCLRGGALALTVPPFSLGFGATLEAQAIGLPPEWGKPGNGDWFMAYGLEATALIDVIFADLMVHATHDWIHDSIGRNSLEATLYVRPWSRKYNPSGWTLAIGMNASSLVYVTSEKYSQAEMPQRFSNIEFLFGVSYVGGILKK